MALKKEEISRKILHFIFGTIIPLGILYVPWYAEKQGWNTVPPWTLPPLILGVFLAGFVIMETLRFKFPAIQNLVHKLGSGFLRKEEEKKQQEQPISTPRHSYVPSFSRTIPRCLSW